MAISKLLRREKTNVGVNGTTSMYTSGIYKVPYGKAKFQIGGKGSSGNATEPSYYNGDQIGNLVPATSPVYDFKVEYQTQMYDPSKIPYPPAYSSVSGNTYYSQSNPDVKHVSYLVNFHSLSNTDLSGTNAYSQTPNTSPQGNGYTVYYVGHTLNSYTPGQPAYYNTVPGSYNPTYPGYAGPTYSTLGVSFPGGSANHGATPIVPQYVTIPYSQEGVSINVAPNGGRVDIIVS